MSTNNKKRYTAPQLLTVELDNEISLALESLPPFGPDEMMLNPELISPMSELGPIL